MEQELEDRHRREKDIVRRIRQREERALRDLIDLHGGLLTAIVNRHLSGSRQDREECLDDVLLAIWNHIESFDGERNSFKQWAAAVAKYRAIDYQRRWIKEQERRTSEELDPDRLRNMDEGNTAARTSAEDVLAQLPEDERRLFERYYIEGVPTKEIAKALDVRESWIHNKLSRGRKKLKRLWTAGGEVQGK
ncbi:sigma-70 family RNA polymerase sigma factor [Saccharibacillus kuerlensis]|uniref:DNA-directed RNA polymerase sigma-70 factor n=1 Tax=Saccharibacillus kuerlensis TaxID=459527 RepID=A0ABQ2L696_9BACL|nr:sigma-70 family RNA polymerase sigma factor [Saccharibacillus kuerlensis]GGO04933.1 DNA-directed RNA polymerase sigma-70 factor [Saccharibacillus kuerlensis]